MPPTGSALLFTSLLTLAEPSAGSGIPNPRWTLAARRDLTEQRRTLGLDERHGFQVAGFQEDPEGGAHVRLRQSFLGVPVWGGEAITHRDPAGRLLPLTDRLWRGIDLSVEPSLPPSEALARVHAELAPKGPYAHPPQVGLEIRPRVQRYLREGAPGGGRDALDWACRAEGFQLVYHVHVQLENGPGETVHRDFLVDAREGAILSSWDSLRTAAAVGTGITQYSGKVRLDTTLGPKGFQLRDSTRGKGGVFGNNVVTDLRHATRGRGALLNDEDNIWGDGTNYQGSLPTDGPTGQTAAADAAYGTQVTWDLYRNVFARNGIDGQGKAIYSRVHYGTAYENAFWDDTCFCMTYGDGKRLKSLETVDVTGHEISHGLCTQSADLAYQGESGGLNEANSDIFGTLAEFYAQGGGFEARATRIPDHGGNWTMAEQLGTSPLRYLYKPSKDGFSPDVWSAELADLDVHYSSGPMNRCFFFLSQGASAKPGDEHAEDLPAGMAGIGIDAAARIWYRALTLYLGMDSGYKEARSACIRAAQDLFGAGKPQEQAVWNAFHAIRVGPAWKEAPPKGPSRLRGEAPVSEEGGRVL